jgi:hypothetical protein
MKRTLAALLFVSALNSAFALPSFDPFANATGSGGTAYTVGSPLAPNTSTNIEGGLNNWVLTGSTFTSTNPQPVIVAGNLSYSGLPASTGNSVSNTPPASGSGGGARFGLNLAAPPSIVYYSFILKVTDISAVPGTPTSNPIAALSDTTTAQAATITRLGGRLVTMTSGGGYVLGVGKSGLTADYVYDSTVRNVGDVVFVVVSYERAGGATNVNLWVNPAPGSIGIDPPPTPTASVPQGAPSNDLNNSGAAALALLCQNTTIPSCIIDEVRVATNWAKVTGGNPTFPISITSQPASRTVKAGDRVAFVVGASGTSPTYHWRFNGTGIQDATNAAYAIANADPTNAGSYSVVVSNSINAVTSAPAAVLTVSTSALALYPTNLVVVRVGDGSQTLTTSGNSVFLDQYTTAGAYVNTLFIPDTGASALIESGPDLAGSVITGAALTRSADKRLLALSGYNVALGNATALQNTFSTNVPRGIVTVDAAGQVTLALADTNAYSGAHFRGAATDGANNFWGSGSTEGTWYFGLSSTSAVIQTTFVNTRSVDIFNGNLYTLASASGANGLVKFNGLPTTDQGTVANILSGFSSVTTTDFAVDPTDSTIYVTTGSAVQKWQFDGFSWTLSYTLSSGFSEQVRYLTADFSGAAPVLYVTAADLGNGQNRLMTITDTNFSATAVTLVTSGPNQFFKGIRFAPRPALSYRSEGSSLILSWNGPFTLVSATDVSGPYVVVPSASSPYTNSTASPARRFFGLR